jgi:putative ABC transport system substrate-binding protein
MKRREFMILVGGASVAAPPIVWAEARKAIRVGMLIPSAPGAPATRENLGVVRQGLADLGYLEGKNIFFEERGGDGTPERLAAMAAELVAMKVDLIIAISTPAARAAQQATTTIPIVVGSVGDPVQDGFVASLSSPGGNITGTTFLGPELISKRFALLKEMLPDASRIAVLWNSKAFGERTMAAMVGQADDAAKRFGFALKFIDVPGIDHFEGAVAAAVEGHADAAFQFPNTTFYENRAVLVDLLNKYRLPAMYNAREFVEVGGLIGYGASPLSLNRRTAFFVDKIIRGARPADLPVEQPTTFDFAINLKTAKALGIALPPTLLASANSVVE